jgi:3-oxoadipate enol-lactonase
MGTIETTLGRIGYTDNGARGGAMPLIFLHGVGSDKSVWRPQLDHFAGRRRALAFDYPGYGESEFRARATRADFASSIFAALDALEIAQAHVCGLSLGGIIAMEVWAAASQRCESLILADTFALHPEGQAITERSIAAADGGSMRAFAEMRCDFLLAQPADEAVRTEIIETMSRIDPEAYKLGAEAVWNADERAVAQTIKVPTLIVCGTEDQPTPPPLSEALSDLIPNSKVVMIAQAGHLTNLEKPADFNAALEDFLAEIQG